MEILSKEERNRAKLNKEKIRIYLCGPTVYDEIHIGNIRSSLLVDVLVKSLLKKEIPFKYVQNITDVDDKIIEKAISKNETEESISETYKKSYEENLKKLGITLPEMHKVTDNIKIISNFVEEVIENNSAYLSNKNVVFDTKNWKEKYGKVSGQKLDSLLAERTREIEKYSKLNENDFVLWKETQKGVKWIGPNNIEGRPGWHTECSAMISNFFKRETIEIHAGGKDLIFPHHENERIQYLAVNKREICNKWLHFGHLNVKKQKMSKSLSNVITVKDYLILYSPNSLRFLIFNSKYNEDIEINSSKIRQSVRLSEKLFNLNKKIRFFLFSNNFSIENAQINQENYFNLVFEKLETSKLVFEIEKNVSELNRLIGNVFSLDEKNSYEAISKIKILYFICDLLGIVIEKSHYSNEEKVKLEEWVELSKSNNFKEADKKREELQSENIL